MSIYSISNFVESHSQKADVVEPFQLENDHLLKIDLNGEVWTKMGSMVAYKGNIPFKREGIMEQGLGRLVKKSLTGEGTRLSKASGTGLTLKVTQGNPVLTDPNATVAWSANLSPEIKTDISIGTFLGRGSGESIQMLFEGEGFVVVQPFEEIYLQKGQA